MNAKLKNLLVTTGLVTVALGATPAFATGTDAGSTIANTVTLNYQVGGIAQTAIQATDNIIVDRKVSLTVAEVGSVTTSVSPGQTAAVTTFTVTNTSNATIDIGLVAAQQAGGTAAHGGTDAFDLTGLGMFRDTNANGVYDVGTDTAVTYLDELAEDGVATIFIVGNVPIGATNGQVAGVTLTGTAQASGAAGTQGANLAATAGANTAGVDTVLADAAGLAGDVASDGRSSDDDDYTVSAPLMSVFKTSRVISDPINGTTNPKMIPGAVVEYCLIAVNATGGATATNVALSDPLPAQTTYYSTNYVVRVGGSYTGTAPSGTCNADGALTAGAHAAGVVSGTLGSLTAGQTRTILFQVTIN
jgi:uncharacterized repeat protein (TIGR01451 family)